MIHPQRIYMVFISADKTRTQIGLPLKRSLLIGPQLSGTVHSFQDRTTLSSLPCQHFFRLPNCSAYYLTGNRHVDRLQLETGILRMAE